MRVTFDCFDVAVVVAAADDAVAVAGDDSFVSRSLGTISIKKSNCIIQWVDSNEGHR